MKKTITTIIILIWAAIFMSFNTIQNSENQSENVPDYLGIVKAYADAMIKDGRDTYGKEHSPLFASALDRRTMKIGSFEDIPGVRNGDRSLLGSNPQEDRDLYTILYRLTEISGENKYAEEANLALKYFFSHCQSPVTGLMTWGEHLYWDFEKEKMGGIDSNHEIGGEWPFWDECYKFNPEACWKFAIGQWDHQIGDKETGDFSRHAKWSEHGPKTGADFPRYAGQLIANWVDAYMREENADKERLPEMVTAISTLVTRMEDNMKKSQTGYLLAGTDDTHSQISWPSHNMELARCLWNALPYMDYKLAKRMKRLALQQDYHFHSMPHTINSGGGFVATIDSRTGEPRKRSMNTPYTATWSSGYGYKIHAQMANRCFTRFEQLENDYPELAEKYKQIILAAAKLYLTATPDNNDLLKPKSIANVITLLINSYNITGEKKYLERANYFGQLGINLFLDDGLPLPKATNNHDHYESITGGPLFMYALLNLYEALEDIQTPKI